MITILKSYAADPVEIDGIVMSRAVMTMAGLSSDEKPTGIYSGTVIANGSSFIEINTGKTFMYDAEGEAWSEQAGGGSGGGSGSGVTAAEIIQLITLAMGNNPITRIVVEDAAETELEIENWDTEYVIPGTSLETLTITLPETTPTALSSCIKVTILGITRHADPEDESEDPLLIPPTIILPEGLVIVGGYPEQDGDRWVLTIDNNMTATAMVIPNPTV